MLGRHAALAPFLLLAGALALPGCKRAPAAPSAPPKTPTLRVFVITSMAGALEPCGCVKDMLGGIDHAAALLAARRDSASSSLLVGAGPTLFMDPTTKEDQRIQTGFKAAAIAESLKDMRLVAWAPAANDWAGGVEELERLKGISGAALLGANLAGRSAGAEALKVVEAGGHKIGIVGVSQPLQSGVAPEGVEVKDARAALEEAKKVLDAQGARIRIALVAMPRGEALRLTEAVGGFQLVVVGKPVDRGEANDGVVPPALLGESLVVQTPNHLQGVAVVDFFVRGDDVRFKDGSGLAQAEKREGLRRRVEDLNRLIAEAEKPDSGVRPEDLAARRKDKDALARELAQHQAPEVPAEGSFFRYEFEPVKESLGADGAVAARLKAYYKRVNAHNKAAFAERRPAPAPAGKASYVGAESCAECHADEYKVWLSTPHATAYAPLERDDKQFNLDCVGCHVTGYDKPGGSTVTFVDKLKNIQCENCHGPSSLHVAAPKDKSLIQRTPPKTFCATECHHPPHVKNDWSVEQAWPRVLGPGHGM